MTDSPIPRFLMVTPSFSYLELVALLVDSLPVVIGPGGLKLDRLVTERACWE